MPFNKLVVIENTTHHQSSLSNKKDHRKWLLINNKISSISSNSNNSKGKEKRKCWRQLIMNVRVGAVTFKCASWRKIISRLIRYLIIIRVYAKNLTLIWSNWHNNFLCRGSSSRTKLLTYIKSEIITVKSHWKKYHQKNRFIRATKMFLKYSLPISMKPMTYKKTLKCLLRTHNPKTFSKAAISSKNK